MDVDQRVRKAGADVFTDDATLDAWLSEPARWADGNTPRQLIEEGRVDDVVGALLGLAHGNFL